jgi:hypothetical protein
LAIDEIVGASFTAVTVSRNDVDADALPSLTVMVTVEVPLWFATGISVIVRLAPDPPKTMLLAGNSVVLVELRESVSDPAAVSASPTVKAIGPRSVSSGVDWLAMVEMVGVSLTEVTVTWNDVEVDAAPSLTVTVMVTVPERFADGVTVTVRVSPDPPKTIPVNGTSVVLLDARLRVRDPTAVSTSPTTKARGAVDESSTMVTLPMVVMVGGSFTDVTVRTNVSTVLPSALVAVKVIVVVPNALASGVIVSERSVPVPATTRLADVTRLAFDEVAVTVVSSADEAGPTEKFSVRAVSSGVVWLSIFENEGGAATTGQANRRTSHVHAITASARDRCGGVFLEAGMDTTNSDRSYHRNYSSTVLVPIEFS